jgi:hypothetical protein
VGACAVAPAGWKLSPAIRGFGAACATGALGGPAFFSSSGFGADGGTAVVTFSISGSLGSE